MLSSEKLSPAQSFGVCVTHEVKVFFGESHNFVGKLFVFAELFTVQVKLNACGSHAPVVVLQVGMADISTFGNVNDTLIT